MQFQNTKNIRDRIMVFGNLKDNLKMIRKVSFSEIFLILKHRKNYQDFCEHLCSKPSKIARKVVDENAIEGESISNHQAELKRQQIAISIANLLCFNEPINRFIFVVRLTANLKYISSQERYSRLSLFQGTHLPTQDDS